MVVAFPFVAPLQRAGVYPPRRRRASEPMPASRLRLGECLRPFPGAALARSARGAQRIAALARRALEDWPREIVLLAAAAIVAHGSAMSFLSFVSSAHSSSVH